MTCESCKHWERAVAMDSEGGEYVDHPASELMPRGADYLPAVAPEDVRIGKCGSPKVLFFEHPPVGGAAILDGSEYMGMLFTDRDFGCVLHEEKDP